MEKKFKVITIALFLIILFGVGIFTVLNGGEKYSVFEKRNLAQFPKTNVKTITKAEFQSGLNDYLNDHVVFRDQCVYVTTMVDKLMGRAEKGGVYFGKDGYLLEKHKKVSEKDIKNNVKCLSDFINMSSESIGPENTRVVMIPSKENILADKLPAYAPKNYQNIHMKGMLKDALKDKSTMLDLTKSLMAHRDEYVYYKTDHHWTSLGAKYGYQGIAKSLGLKAQKRKPKVVADDFLGSTYNKIHYAPQKDIITEYVGKYPKETYGVTIDNSGEMSKIPDIYVPKALKKDDKYEYFMGGNYGGVRMRTHCTNGKTLVLIKDSFANCIVPFLTDNYENIVMIDLRYINGLGDTLSQLEVEQMDTLVVLFNEDKFMSDSHLDLLMQ